jgi:signal transduction histidine kinase
MSGDADLRMKASEVLAPVVADAAFRGERQIAWLRIGFCGVVLARFVALDQAGVFPYLVNIPAILLAIACSGWILGQIRRRRASYRALVVSVSVDAIVCFVSLLQTVLWPRPGAAYAGLLCLPDVAAILVTTFAAGFRVWPRLAAFGGAFNLASYLALLAIDRYAWGSALRYGTHEAVFFLILLSAVVALSLATAVRTLKLVESGADATLRFDRARRSLTELVRDHHDARSLLSAAAVTSELILRSLPAAPAGQDGAPGDEVPSRARRLKEDLEVATGFLTEVSERAYDELEALSEPQIVELSQVLPTVVERLRGRFPSLPLELVIRGDAAVHLPGGARSLERMLYNFVDNAVDGDGNRGASRVWFRSDVRDALVSLTVEDDGPGFGAAVPVRQTSKRRGMGIGLELAGRVLTAVGGQLTCSNRSEGGARVSLELPLATSDGLSRGGAPANREGVARTFALPASDRVR